METLYIILAFLVVIGIICLIAIIIGRKQFMEGLSNTYKDVYVTSLRKSVEDNNKRLEELEKKDEAKKD